MECSSLSLQNHPQISFRAWHEPHAACPSISVGDIFQPRVSRRPIHGNLLAKHVRQFVKSKQRACFHRWLTDFPRRPRKFARNSRSQGRSIARQSLSCARVLLDNPRTAGGRRRLLPHFPFPPPRHRGAEFREIPSEPKLLVRQVFPRDRSSLIKNPTVVWCDDQNDRSPRSSRTKHFAAKPNEP